jgi:hypothetical protein
VTVDQVDASLGLFFNKLKTFMPLSGIIYIVSFIVVIVIVVLYFSVIMAVIAGKTGMHP